MQPLEGEIIYFNIDSAAVLLLLDPIVFINMEEKDNGYQQANNRFLVGLVLKVIVVGLAIFYN